MTVDKDMPILIVDDDDTMLAAVRNLLGQLGFTNIEAAGGGAQALSTLSHTKTDLVISDWNMEPMSGLDLLKAVRADASLTHIPFILATANHRAENMLVAKDAGANSYIVKPFTVETLKAKMSAVIGAF